LRTGTEQETSLTEVSMHDDESTMWEETPSLTKHANGTGEDILITPVEGGFLVTRNGQTTFETPNIVLDPVLPTNRLDVASTDLGSGENLIRPPLPTGNPNEGLTPSTKVDMPEARWVSFYFKLIDELTKRADWTPLREMVVPLGSLEVRVWIGFGEGSLEGLRFRRNGEEWTGFYTSENHFRWKSVYENQHLLNEEQKKYWESYLSYHKESKPFYDLTPKTIDWTNLWERVEDLGILTLPDDSDLPSEGFYILGGISYVVEINDGESYRTYKYGNPQSRKWPEAEKMIEIIKTFHDEFQHLLPHHVSWGYWK